MAFFDNLGSKISNVGRQSVDKAKEIRDTSRLSIDIRSEENTVEKLYAEIGKLYYEEHKDDEKPKYGQILEITAALKKIHDLQNEKMNIRGMVRCSHCGKPVSRTASFCPNCGTKVEVPEEEEPVTGDVVNEAGETVHEAAEPETPKAETEAPKTETEAPKAETEAPKTEEETSEAEEEGKSTEI